jgi:hypothetical protein
VEAPTRARVAAAAVARTVSFMGDVGFEVLMDSPVSGFFPNLAVMSE